MFFILFSDEKVVRKFGLIETLLFPDSHHALVYGVAYPALLAALYVFVYPWPARLVYIYLRKQQKRTLEVKYKLDDETPVTEERIRAFNRANRSRISKFESEIDERDQRIANLERELVEAEGRVKAMEGRRSSVDEETLAKVVPAPVELSALQREILFRMLDGHPNQASESGLGKLFGDPARVAFELEELRLKDLVEPTGDTAGGPNWRLSHHGLKMLFSEKAEREKPAEKTLSGREASEEVIRARIRKDPVGALQEAWNALQERMDAWAKKNGFSSWEEPGAMAQTMADEELNTVRSLRAFSTLASSVTIPISEAAAFDVIDQMQYYEWQVGMHMREGPME
jgi:hypothetical protein